MTTNQCLWDTLIQGALVFDGSGRSPQYVDIGVKDGKIVDKGTQLPSEQALETVDAQGMWLLPGLLDIHTHLDLEVELDPGLHEVVRHGTTTVLIGNCSLGTCFGSQRINIQDPVLDCFTRVENIPKRVLAKSVERMTWDNSLDYLSHFGNLKIGPNIAAFVPHSMLRIEVMGLQASISRQPTAQELDKMCALLEDALDQGFLGLSTDGLPFHYLANAPNVEKRIPSQFASFKEMRRLLKVVRDKGRVWQTTPILQSRLKALMYFALTSGRLFGKTLKTSALAAVDFSLLRGKPNPFLGFARLMNSRLFQGNIHFQALGSVFRVWSDGVVCPMFEEMPSTRKLIALDYDDVDGRQALLRDPEWINNFRRDWQHGRFGFNLARLREKYLIPDCLVIRDFNQLFFDGAPVPEWDGKSFQEVFNRLQRFQRGMLANTRSDTEYEAFATFPSPIKDDAQFMIHMMQTYDKNFRFYADQGNSDDSRVLELLLHDHTMPGFNDSGAHITNMAFYDGNLVSLKRALQSGLEVFSKMVQRLTTEPSAFFGLDTGTLDIGAQADLTLINPKALSTYDTNRNRKMIYRQIFDHNQMVNRSDGVVERVIIRGETVWKHTFFTTVLGSKPLGRALRAS